MSATISPTALDSQPKPSPLQHISIENGVVTIADPYTTGHSYNCSLAQAHTLLRHSDYLGGDLSGIEKLEFALAEYPAEGDTVPAFPKEKMTASTFWFLFEIEKPPTCSTPADPTGPGVPQPLPPISHNPPNVPKQPVARLPAIFTIPDHLDHDARRDFVTQNAMVEFIAGTLSKQSKDRHYKVKRKAEKVSKRAAGGSSSALPVMGMPVSAKMKAKKKKSRSRKRRAAAGQDASSTIDPMVIG